MVVYVYKQKYNLRQKKVGYNHNLWTIQFNPKHRYNQSLWSNRVKPIFPTFDVKAFGSNGSKFVYSFMDWKIKSYGGTILISI